MLAYNQCGGQPPLGLMPPTWLLLSIGLMCGMRWLVPVMVLVPRPWNLSGVAVIGVGVWLAVAADQQFKRHATTVKPFQQSSCS